MKKISSKKVTAGILIAIITIFTLLGISYFPILLPCLLSLMALQGVREFCNLFEKNGYNIPKTLVMLFSLAVIWDVYLAQGIYFGRILILFVMFAPFLEIITKKKLPDFASISLGIFAIIYIAGLLSYTIKIWQLTYSVKYLILVIGVTGICDIFCYFSGVIFGKRKIFPSLSPNKTLEGWIGGILFSVIVCILISKIQFTNNYFGLSFSQYIILALLISISGQIGDVFESSIKRALHVKDTGDLIPEHGGIMDRIDSILFTGILSYYFLFWSYPLR